VLLQGVVADRGGGGQGLLDVAVLEQVAALGGVGPHAGVAVGLQLEADGQAAVAVALAAGRAVDPLGGAEDVLDVVADLVGDDVGLGEVAAGAELAREDVVEGEVDVRALVARAVERAGGGLAEAAGGVGGAGEQDQLGAAVGLALDRRQALPGVLDVVEDEPDERGLVRRRGPVGRVWPTACAPPC
jgi:hypothetical protein